MRILRQSAFCIMLLSSVAAQAQLAVTVSPTKVVGQKAIVPLTLKNNLSEKIESARAVCFLLNEQGKMVGQSTKWVIGGQAGPALKTGLRPGATNSFHFAIPLTGNNPRQLAQFASTNLTAKVQFNRVVLAGGKLADVAKEVTVIPVRK